MFRDLLHWDEPLRREARELMLPGSSRTRILVTSAAMLLIIGVSAGVPRVAAAMGSAWFTYTPLNPIAGQQITFYPSCGPYPPCDFYWIWNDGTPNQSSSSTVMTHTFAAAGDHTVTLQATDFQGNPGIVSRTLTLGAAGSRLVSIGNFNAIACPSPGTASPTAPDVSSPFLTLSNSFDGLNLAQGGATPPDVQVAVGPNYIVEAVNFVIGIYSRPANNQVVLQRSCGLAQFFGSPQASLGDPKILYDIQSALFYATEIVQSAATTWTVRIAISNTNDPTGGWMLYELPYGQNILPDQPLIGISADKFVVSANDFSLQTGNFLGADYWVLNRGQMASGGSYDVDFYTSGANNNLASVYPVQSQTATSSQYMVSAFQNNLRLITLTGLPNVNLAATTAAVPGVRQITTPVVAVQPAPGPPIDTGGRIGPSAQVTTGVFANGIIWLAFSEACNGLSCVRIIQINTVPNAPLQDFDITAAGTHYFYPALSVDSAGDLVVVEGVSSANINPSLEVRAEVNSNPVSTLSPPVALATGLSPTPQCGPNTCRADGSIRYGDYFGTSIDPIDQTLVWVAGEYQPTPNWGTRLGSVRLPDFSLSASPTSFSVTQGSSYAVSLTVGSVQGFSGTVQLSIALPSSSWSVSGFPSSLSVNSGSSSSTSFNIYPGSSPTGTYTVTITGSSSLNPSYTWSHTISMSVTVNAPSCGCGGGGSIAYGSLITMADGSQVPVQNLQVGAKMLGYDTTTGTYTVSIVKSITVVDTTNMLVIHTSDGTPFRVDANPRQTLWVKTAAGTIGWVPVTQIKVGDDLFTQNGWVPVTSIEFAPAGTHVMYDIVASTPYFADGYLDPIVKL